MSNVEIGNFIKSIREPLFDEIIMTENYSDKLALVGVDLWLTSNSSEINTIEDFDNKVSSFNQIVEHPLYIKMVDNLNVSQLVSAYIKNRITEEEFTKAVCEISEDSIEGITDYIRSDSKVELGERSYSCARSLFNQLVNDSFVKRLADDCKFAMNFSFSDNWQEDSRGLYYSSLSFLEISDKLKSISKKIGGNQNGVDNVEHIKGFERLRSEEIFGKQK